MMISKAQLRKDYIARRQSLGDAETHAEVRVRDNVLKLMSSQKSCVLAGYAAIKDELDLAPTMAALHDTGVALCLPVSSPDPDALTFRRWAPETVMENGPFGTSQPGKTAEEVKPDVLLVPLVAFDRTGHRIGYGQGYYDRTLHVLRQEKNIAAYGIGFDGQETDVVPRAAHDVPLDGVITPTRTLMVNSDLSGAL